LTHLPRQNKRRVQGEQKKKSIYKEKIRKNDNLRAKGGKRRNEGGNAKKKKKWEDTIKIE